MIYIVEITINVLRSVLNINLSLDGFVLMSLACQFILLMAPMRKRVRSVWLFFSIVQLLQVAIAGYVQSSVPNDCSRGGRKGELRVFWVPFILLHLGGPHTLTSLTQSDNELWLRFAARFWTLSHSFGILVYGHSFLENDLWWPTVLMFVAGALSFFEKVICRYLAQIAKFRESALPKPDTGVNYAEILKTLNFFVESGIPVELVETSSAVVGDSAACSIRPGSDDKLSQVKIVKEAYRFFNEFKGLFVNSVFSYNQRDRIRRYFLGIKDAEDAFSICEAELNFAYDVFYTKAMLIHKFNCYVLLIINLVSFVLQFITLVMWIGIDKHKFQKRSVLVTNILVGGTLAHFLLSLLIFSTSDWCIVGVIKDEEILGAKSKLSSFYESVLTARTATCLGPLRGIRWSRRIPQLNLLRNIVFTSILENVADRTARPCSAAHSTKGLMKFIFDELVIRSRYAELPEDVQDVCPATGSWVLHQLSQDMDMVETFRPWISNVEYEESLILWHLATTLCYYCTSEEEDNGQISDLRILSKTISDYMLFLLIRQPEMMPTSAGTSSQIIFSDTFAEGRRFCNRVLPITPLVVFPPSKSGSMVEKRLREASRKILEVNTGPISPRLIRGDESKALLFDACVLAKKLGGLSNKWEIISKVLAEMLFISAAYSSPFDHLQKLKNGGELLTLVWLLMPHLGLGMHFRRKKRRSDRTAEIVIN